MAYSLFVFNAFIFAVSISFNTQYSMHRLCIFPLFSFFRALWVNNGLKIECSEK